MDNKQSEFNRQHGMYSGVFVGLGIGVISTTLFGYLLAPASLFGASLVVGGIITALGIALHFMPVVRLDSLDERERNRLIVNEFINEWRGQGGVKQRQPEVDY